MLLRELGQLFAVSRIIGDDAVEVSGIEADSRKVSPGDLFICVRGFTTDGHQHAGQAVAAGACALVVEEPLPVQVPMLVVKDSRRAMAVIASHFYG